MDTGSVAPNAVVIPQGRRALDTCHQISFGKNRNVNKIVQCLHVSGFKPCRAPVLLVKRYLPRTLDHAREALLLQFAQLTRVERCWTVEKSGADWVGA